jgi:hypothetical protein
MADRVMTILWMDAARGREEMALDAFNDSVGLYDRLQEEGRIERVDVTIYSPNAKIRGCFNLFGTAEQLADVREDEEFVRLLVEAGMAVDGINVIQGYFNEGAIGQLGVWTEAIQKVSKATAAA